MTAAQLFVATVKFLALFSANFSISIATSQQSTVTVKVSVAFEFFYAAFFIVSASSLCSGFKVTSVTLFQLRVWPLQRSGLAVRAA